jgi:hypothetical protein
MIARRAALYDTMYSSRRLVARVGDKAAFKFRGTQIDGRRHLIGAKDMSSLSVSQVRSNPTHTQRRTKSIDRENGRSSERFAQETSQMALSSTNMSRGCKKSSSGMEDYRPRKNLGILAVDGAKDDSSRWIHRRSSCGRINFTLATLSFASIPFCFFFFLFCLFITFERFVLFP